MKTVVETTNAVDVSADWLVVPIGKEQELSGPIAPLDEALGGLIRALIETGDFDGKSCQLLPVHRAEGVAAQRVLLTGTGEPEKLNAQGLERAIAAAARSISEKAVDRVAIVPAAGVEEVEFCRAAAIAVTNGCVGQDLYRAEKKRFPIGELVIISDGTQNGESGATVGGVIGDAIVLTRELVDRPPQDLYPESFAQRARQIADETGMEIDVLDDKRLAEERMQSMLAVGRGSDRSSRMVVLKYNGGTAGGPVLGLIGKGVTFDSGGLSLKPSDSMKTMKCDMAGAATVLGAMSAITRLKLPVNVIGLMGLVENMPGGSAFKLGDVLTARNGKTIEVLNTDAEGRLVLADVLSYAVDAGASRMIDLATLTGACVVALGEDVAGAFTNDQSWCDVVLESARDRGEDVWQLPMLELYGELISGDISDIKNVGPRWGGAITAAKFLENFVDETPWVHLDIAGPSFASSAKSWREAGATGCMVRTLVEVATRFSDVSS